MKVTLEVREQEHCGYCSDPYDKTEKEYDIIRFWNDSFPHYNSFSEATNITYKSSIFNNIHQEIFDFAKSKFDIEIPCERCSGYCGFQTTYSVKKIKIIKIKQCSLPKP